MLTDKLKIHAKEKNPAITDSGYVLKNSDGLYFIGFNKADMQLRKAKIYHKTRLAEQTMKEINENHHRIPYVRHDFKMVKVEIRECP